MATIGDILNACAAAKIPTEQVENIEIILLSDGDEVSYDVSGYDDENDQFVLVTAEIEVPTSTKDVTTETITVTVPVGVEVKVERSE